MGQMLSEPITVNYSLIPKFDTIPREWEQFTKYVRRTYTPSLYGNVL